MKTSKLDKLEHELVAEEAKLREHLLRILPEVAESGSSVFTNSEFNPSKLPAHMFRTDAESLLGRARECIRLREALGVDLAGSVGAIFLAACEEHGSKDPQRRGPRRLASSLLLALGNGT